MSELKRHVIQKIMDRYDGAVDHPDDYGGPSRWGITQERARSYGYRGDMADFPPMAAEEMHANYHWHSLKLTVIEAISDQVAEELAEMSIDLNPQITAVYLQRCINVLGEGGRYHPGISVDGRVGHRTVAALREILERRQVNGELALLRMLNKLHGAKQLEQVEKRERPAPGFISWLLHRTA